jgi:hypothetical protein
VRGEVRGRPGRMPGRLLREPQQRQLQLRRVRPDLPGRNVLQRRPVSLTPRTVYRATAPAAW